MKKIITAAVLGASMIASASAIADASFVCPDPSKVLADNPNPVSAYALYDPSTGMPEDLAKTTDLGELGWFGFIAPIPSVDSASFESVLIPTSDGPVLCAYSLKSKSGQTVGVDMTPANPQYLNLYKYSLSNGKTFSTDITTKIIAVSTK